MLRGNVPRNHLPKGTIQEARPLSETEVRVCELYDQKVSAPKIARTVRP